MVYYYLQKNRAAKRSFFAKMQLNEFCVERQDRLAIKVIGIPEYYRERAGKKKKRVPWNKERLEQVLGERFQESGAEYFYFGKETAVFLGMERPSVPLFFMEEMLLQYGIRENLILIGNPNLLFDSIFCNFMSRVNFLKIICENPQDYEGAAEWLYQNYGIIAVLETKESIQRRRRLRSEGGTSEKAESEKEEHETLVIDMEHSGKNGRPQAELWEFPAGTLYMDMCSEIEKTRWIAKKRSDIRYVSPENLLNKWCHLDTIVQNGYNTRVKLEVL